MLSQIVAVVGVNLRSIRQRLGSSTVAIIGIAGVVVVFLGRAVDRRRLHGGDGLGRRSPDDHRHARGQRHRDDERPERRHGAAHHGHAGHRAQRARPGGLARALRHRRAPDQEGPERRERAAPGRLGRGARRASRSEDRRRADVHARAPTRSSSGRAASRQFAGLTVGSSTKWGQNKWHGGRHLRGARQRRGVGNLDRRQGAAARVSARQQLPVGLRPAPEPSTAFQAFKDALTANPADLGDGDSRARVLRGAVARC